MKKNYESNPSSLKKAAKGLMIAVGLAIIGGATSYGQTLIDEDFTGQVLPTGWDTTDISGSGVGFVFDNPDPRTITGGTPGFDADFVILDSDHFGSSSNTEDAVLESASFDASQAGGYQLSFDNQFRSISGATSGAGTPTIEVWDGTSWVTVATFPMGTDEGYPNPANHKSIDITAAAGGSNVAKVRFHWVNGSWDWWWAIDNVKIERITCAAPTALAVTNIGSSTADISWTASATPPANGYEYYYSTSSTTPTTTTSASGAVGAGVLTTSLSGLSANTQYYVWVRSLCSATDTSDWSASTTFTTLPAPQVPATLPYSDDFTTSSADWTMLNGTEINQWYIGAATGNSGNSLYVSDDGGTTNDYSIGDASVVHAYRDIILPAGSNPFKLQFDWQSIGEDGWDFFRVWLVPHTYVPVPGSEISSGAGQLQFGGDFSDENASPPSWTTTSFIIPDSLAGDTVRLVFEWQNDGSGGTSPGAAIDNVNVTEISCSAPTAVTSGNVTNAAADISWTAPSTAPADGYQYYYSISSTAPSSATPASGSVGVGITTAGLTTLTANTQYYVWVRSICSAADTSDWAGGISFTTLCNAEAIPYVAPLATVSTPDVPSCMSTELINTSGTEWYTSNAPGSGFTENTLVSTFTDPGDGAVDSWVYTNGLLLTGGIAYQLHYRYGNNSISYSEKLEVKYGTSPAVSSMTTLLTDHSDINDAVPHDTMVLFTPAATGTYYIGFHAYSDEDQYRLYLDSISVSLVPCDSAIALTATNITSTSADLSWSGAAGQYTLEYGSAGFTPGTGTFVSVTGNTYILNNLDPNGAYDYYVRSICTPGSDSSAYSEAATFTTLCDPILVNLGNDTAFCSGNSVTLDAGNPGATFLWSDASTSQTLNATASGDYYAVVTDMYGCTGSDTVSVTVHSLPVVDLGPDTAICGDTLILDAGNAGSTYIWNDASTQQTLDANTSGDYSVVVTDANGCIASDTLILTVNDLPVVDLGPDTSACAGDTIILDAGNAGSDFLWSDGTTAQTLAVSLTGDYWVSVTNAGGCSASDTIHVEITPLPSVDGITVTDNGNGTYTFEASNPANVSAYQWDFGDGSPNSYNVSPTHTYANTGTDSITVILIVTNDCGSDSASITIPGPGVGIQQIEPGKDRLKLYPNPAQDLITIRNESQFKMEGITVYNMLGQMVFQVFPKDARIYSLDLSEFIPGIYSVKIKMDGGWIMRKFEVLK